MGKPAIAKLSRPRLHRAVARPRLHARLNALRGAGCVWIAAPPGSGKTTLVASWVQSLATHCFWYRVDAGDSDPATLFSFLAISVSRHRRRGQSLPQFSADYQGDLVHFSRQFFRQYYSCLSPDSVLVFDNYQEATGPDCHAVIRAAVDELPDGVSLVIVSRQLPPVEVSSHLINHEIRLIEWGEMRLDGDEVAALIGAHEAASAERIAQLAQASDGWAAGLMLMLAHGKGDGISGAPAGLQSREFLFGYFAEEILDRAPGSDQEVLMQTALFPQIAPSTAIRLTGDANAPAVLDQLFRKQYFVNRHLAPDVSYHYHDLFRQFLIDRAARTYGTTAWAQLRLKAAEIMLDSGEEEQALGLFSEVAAWSRVRAVVSSRAGSLMRQGRWQTLISWIGHLPEAEVVSDAWMLYWKGVATAVTGIRQGRTTLEESAAAFDLAGDAAGIILTASTVVDSYFQEWDTVAELDPWLDKLLHALNEPDGQVTPEIRSRAEASLMIGLLHRRPGHPQLRRLASLMADRAGLEPDPAERLRECTFLLLYFDLMGDFARAFECFGPALALIEDVSVAPRLRLWALSWQIRHHAACADFGRALACSVAALDLSKQTGVSIAPAFMYVQHAQALLEAGRSEEAWTWIQQARPLLSPRYEMESVFFHWLELWVVVALKDYPKAQRMWDEFTTRRTVGVPFNTAYNLPAVFLMSERGDSAGALERVSRWRSMLTEMASPWLLYNLDLMEAYARLRAGQYEAADSVLTRALDAAAAHGFYSTLAWVPAMMTPLLARALHSNIQVEFTEQLIRRRGVRSPPYVPRWPWPIKIFTLGRFLVMREGVPIKFAHRPQHKTLALLKAIIAAGASGIGVSELVAHLWPDTDGDAGRNAFHVALSRLRRLLGENNAVLLEAGRVRLHEEICWVDAFDFDRGVTDLLTDDGGHLPATQDPSRIAALYCGPFLGDEPEVPWALSCRDRLHAKYIRVVVSIGNRLERARQWGEAAELYRRALEVDNLQEDIYRRLMRCHAARGETAEAMTAYRRCRELLSIVLGVVPSPETEALHRSLHGG